MDGALDMLGKPSDDVITRLHQSSGQIEWFEVYMTYRDGGKPISADSKRNGSKLESPIKLAKDIGAEIAVNDDFYHYRAMYNQRTGSVVRDLVFLIR